MLESESMESLSREKRDLRRKNIVVDHIDDPVRCPECGKEARKGQGVDLPIGSLAGVRNGELTTGRLGRAYCETPECSFHTHDDFIFWSVG